MRGSVWQHSEPMESNPLTTGSEEDTRDGATDTLDGPPKQNKDDSRLLFSSSFGGLPAAKKTPSC
jgi:hypothetical protein